MRFLSYIPAVTKPIGGIAVTLELIDVLNRNGFNALAIYERPDLSHNAHTLEAPRVWSARVAKPKPAKRGRRLMLAIDKVLGLGAKAPGNAAHCAEWQPEPGDVLIVPEFVAHWLPDRMPAGMPKYLVNQNAFSLLRISILPGFDVSAFAGSIATSDICDASSRMILGTEPTRLPLFLSKELYEFEPNKKFQIAYMPRKRQRDAKILVKALKAHPALADMTFVPIQGLSSAEAARLTRESLFFLSFSWLEGFGLPPAEAIATGCITMGYTGVGGDEFFTEETGFPVPEENLPAFYDTVVSVVERYRETPDALEAFRRQASEKLLAKYPRDAFEREVLRIFGEWRAAATT